MKLSNKYLQIEVSALGAELKSIKLENIEYLWNGNPNYWKRSSPVLFPIVGRLLDDEYSYEGELYTMTQHGFARDCEFDLIEETDTSVKYRLVSNKDTYKVYPFDFELDIEYILEDNNLIVKWVVTNKDSKVMPFQIGAHPAFNFLNGSLIEISQKTNQYLLNKTPYIQQIERDINVDSILVDNTSFINDAIVYDNVDRVILRDEKKQVAIDCKGFPYIGLWTKVTNNENAPFICLEPWYGIADFKNHNKNLLDKKGMNFLKSQEIFKASYQIKLSR